MINRVKEKLANNFTIIPNELFNGELSPKAVGIFAYLCSKDDNWVFYQKEIQEHFKIGIDAVSSALKELEKVGLLLRYRERKNGKFGDMIYILYPSKEDYKRAEKNNTEFAYTGKSNIDKHHIDKSKTNNKDNNNIENKNKDSNNKELKEKNVKKRKNLQEQIEQKIQENPNLNVEAFREWLDYKNYKKIIGVTKSINFLVQYDKETQQKIIDQSIMNEYAGLFPLKQQFREHPQNYPAGFNPNESVWSEEDESPFEIGFGGYLQ